MKLMETVREDSGTTPKYKWKPGFSVTQKPFKKRRPGRSRGSGSGCIFVPVNPGGNRGETGYEGSRSNVREDGNPRTSSIIHGQALKHESPRDMSSLVASQTLPSGAGSGCERSMFNPVSLRPIQFSSLSKRYEPLFERCES